MDSIIFPGNRCWSVGSHVFFPIIDRIRAALSDDCAARLASVFEPLDRGFQFIALDDEVGPEAFQCFYRAAKGEYL